MTKTKIMRKYTVCREIYQLCQADDSLLTQNKINFDMILASLQQFKEKSTEEFEAGWMKFEKDLYKYETKRKEFTDWAMQK